MQVLEQKFILLSTLLLSFAIILKGAWGLNLASLKDAFLPWAQDKSVN